MPEPSQSRKALTSALRAAGFTEVIKTDPISSKTPEVAHLVLDPDLGEIPVDAPCVELHVDHEGILRCSITWNLGRVQR